MPVGTDQTLEGHSVLLTGASSQIGIFAIPRLLAEGFQVLAVSRKGRPQGYPEFKNVRWLDPESAIEAAQNCRFFMSAGPMKLVQDFLSAGTSFKKLCVFSSSSVETKQESANPGERQQVQHMLKLESNLQSFAVANGIKLLILRPTLIYGCGLDTNISRLAAWIRRFGVIPVNRNGTGLRQPVHADDLASIAVAALLSHESLPPVLSVSGGETLAYSDMVRRVFMALGKPARLVRLPEWLFMLLVRLAGSIKPGSGLNAEMVRRQKQDLVFDDSRARELLDWAPRPFEPGEDDFALPLHLAGTRES